MVICRGERDGRQLLLIGLSRGNVDKLIEGKPIALSEASHGAMAIPGWEIGIMFGETEVAIGMELTKAGVIDDETAILGGVGLDTQTQAPRTYPHGRIGPDDEGAIHAALELDRAHKRLTLRFPKNLSWVSMTASEAQALGKMLIDKAREIA